MCIKTTRNGSHQCGSHFVFWSSGILLFFFLMSKNINWICLMAINNICKAAFFGIVGNTIVKNFSGGRLADSLCFLYGTIKKIGNIIANVGVVIKEYLIGASKLLSFLVRPISTLFAFTCGCHTNLAWSPPVLWQLASRLPWIQSY